MENPFLNGVFSKLKWYKNTEVLPAKTRFTTNYDVKTGVVSLKINDARPDDVGNYRVTASNIIGADETSADASLIDPSENPDVKSKNFMAPIILIPLTNTKINEEDEIEFLCKVIGYPKPKVYRLLTNR